MMRIYHPPTYTPKKRPLGLAANANEPSAIKISSKANSNLAKSWSSWLENNKAGQESSIEQVKVLVSGSLVVNDAAHFQKTRVLEKMKKCEQRDLHSKVILKPCPRREPVLDWATNDCKPVLLPYTLGFRDCKTLKLFKLREKRGLRGLNRHFKFMPIERSSLMESQATNQRHPLLLTYSWAE